MDLWVRSQDRAHLVKVERVYYWEHRVLHPITVFHKITTGKETLGNYETKERCLEILDEIQKILMAGPIPILTFTNCDVPEDTYDGLNEMYKKGNLLALCTGASEENIKIIEKSTVVYEMAEK